MSTPAIRLRQLSCAFGATRALNNIDLDVMPGERHGIIGPNGSGKSTLFNVLTGWARPSQGEICIHGASVGRCSPEQVARLGVARTFQYVQLCQSQTVLDNLLVALICERGLAGVFWHRLKAYDSLRDSAIEVLRRLDLLSITDTCVAELSYGIQKRVELAMLLVRKVSIVLLDEPTAGLSASETGDILDVLREIDRTVTVIVIEHDMDVLFGIAERVTVLSAGEMIAHGEAQSVRNHEDVARLYLGTLGAASLSKALS